MVSQVVKTDPHWPPLEESMGQERNLVSSDVVPTPSVSGNHSPSSAPQPMDGLQSTAPPPFLTKTYDMVDDPATDAVVSWSSGNNSFVVWNPPDFAQELLPKYFKHNNFSSFVRQLNTYGFRKVDPDRWEFANEGFLRGRRDLLRTIHRRKPATHSQQPAQPQQQQPHQHQHQLSEPASVGPCVEVGKFGLEGEIERLKRDKNVLMVELVRLRQQQQNTEREMQSMGQRLLTTENRQQHMMSFLAKAMQNPSFLAQLMQQSEKKRLATTVRKKRRLPKQDSSEEDSVGSDTPADNQIVAYNANGGGDANGARAMIMQFFNSTDAASSPSLDDGPLEALFRDLGSAPSGPAGGTNRQSGVTLTEMNTPGLSDALPGPVLMDASPEHDELPMPPHLALRIPRLEGALSMNTDNGIKYSSGDLKPEDLSGESMEFNDDGTRLLPEGEEGISNMGSPGMSAANDSLFWEQFLSESPSAVDHELEQELDLDGDDKEDGDETVGDSVEVLGGEDGGEGKDWWSKKPSVEQLSVQMGQLAPG
ncbi:hypothetical protein M758_6G083300 [Ceratodon purpureus]|uniref:HSF-type DNA-binding domain-containing protein n=1 Tax=Ceratodon purpureus TaxID=3225 RepID=A0A8T0HC30_CERPU|nr:hypothetical protein KC19_6G087900 [Ceratodon purpureus]KAG0613182.1 hypothetical protein M758_6G083300 [Ceratodon purpureus]